MGTRRTYEVAGEKVAVVALPNSTQERLDDFYKFVDSDRILGLDVETTTIEDMGVFAPNARMRLLQLGTKTEAWVLDPHDPFWRPQIQRVLEGADVWSAGTRFVTHTNYDPLWVRREFDINLNERSIDTLPMTCLLLPGERNDHTLKTWASQHIDPGLRHAEEELHAEFKRLAPSGSRVGGKMKSWGFTNIPLNNEIYTKYAGLDAIYVRRLLDILSAMMRSKKERALSRREQNIARMANDMQWRGMRIDRQYTRKILDDIEFDYLKADSELLELFGFSPRSPKVVGWLEERGVRFHERTKTGRGKLDKTTLPILAAQADPLSEVGQALHNKLILSTNQNLLNNLRGILTVADRNDMIHPRINTQAAVTGRSSIVNPAMQTFKKTDKRLRGCFIARDGYLFVGADYDGQETRLAAAYSQDEMLLKILDRGLRQHVETAISIFGKNYTEPEYGDAKILDFAQQYGAGPRKLAAQMGVPYAVALERWKAWRGTYAGLVSWTEFMSTLPNRQAETCSVTP